MFGKSKTCLFRVARDKILNLIVGVARSNSEHVKNRC